jgi:hypothetical protein
MANIGKYNTPGTLVTVLSTELNALANNTLSAASAAINNASNLDILANLELVLAALSPTTGAYIDIYIAEAVDGSNYPTPSGADARLQLTMKLCTFFLGVTASTAQRITIRGVELPPTTFKLYLDNQAGVTLGATGNTLKLLPYDFQLNG